VPKALGRLYRALALVNPEDRNAAMACLVSERKQAEAELAAGAGESEAGPEVDAEVQLHVVQQEAAVKIQAGLRGMMVRLFPIRVSIRA
jgi:hypothetical protein